MPVVKEFGPALPVGNSAGRGLNPRPERSTPAKYLLGFSLSTFRYRCSKSSSRLYRSSKSPDRLCRSATMPVGGTTPDRHKDGTLPLCWLRNADYQIPVRSIGQDLLLPIGNRAGRGLHPRPERSNPAKYLLKLSNDRNAPPRQIPTYASEFVNPSLAQPFPFPSPLQCSCVGGSFRSGMQSPTGARPAQGGS